MRRRSLSIPAGAAPVPGFPLWRHWQVEHAATEYTTHCAYAVRVDTGAVLGPCDWNPSTGWFSSRRAREGWRDLADPSVVEAHDVLSVVMDTLLEGAGMHPRTRWLLDVHAPEYGCFSYQVSVLAQKGYVPQGLADVDPAIAGSYVPRSMERRQLDNFQDWLLQHPEGCPFPLFDPRMHNEGPRAALLVAAADRVKELLKDGQWHGYHEVLAAVGHEAYENGYPLVQVGEVAVWGDADYRREWQARVYVRGKANHTGRYAAWDSEVAAECRASEVRDFRAPAAQSTRVD